MAYDEATTVREAVEAVLAQRVRSAEIRSVVVVSSGSRDGTDEIVRDMLAGDRRLELLTEPTRRGKISAVNLFLRSHPGMDVYVVTNADVVLAPGSLEALLGPFSDPGVGMTGGRIVPWDVAGEAEGFLAFAHWLLWDLHHRIALERPKLGETIAVRPVVSTIPLEMVVDEAYLEAVVRAAGLRCVYVPEAVIRSRGSPDLRGFLAVRRRNAAGHLGLRASRGYEVSTWSLRGVLRALAGAVREGLIPAPPEDRNGLARRVRWGTRRAGWVLVLASLEACARVLGALDARRAPGRHVLWRVSRSTRVVARQH